MEDRKAYLTISEVAVILGVSPARAYSIAAEGGIPVIRRGRRILSPRVAFEVWVDDQVAEALASTRRPATPAL